MKVLEINSVPYGSTGNIVHLLKRKLVENGDEVLCATGFSWQSKNHPDDYVISNIVEKSIHTLFSYVTGLNGLGSIVPTIRFIHVINKFNPDVVHIHNLHGWYINLPLFFMYLKNKNIPVIWTLHDCWAITGHCPYFDIVKCEKWKTGCCDCPSYHDYPQSAVDNSRHMWKLKKKWFTGVEKMTFVTPSQWLANLVKQSYLKDYPIRVINNGIDLSIFKPISTNFRENNNIKNDKQVILGVAFGWGKRKGLDAFIELSRRLDKNKYQIVLVGTDDIVDKQLPENIISIHRTHDQKELAEIYSSADLFVNPTREDNFPTVNLESLACGTPVVTFDTGGSPECIDETCGSVIVCNDIDALNKEIIRICEEHPYSSEACIKRVKSFNMNDKIQEYIELYKE